MYENSEISKRHGSPYDRGGADSYYNRSYNPHYFMGATFQSIEVTQEYMTEKEIAEYKKGYEDNEESGDHKEWD